MCEIEVLAKAYHALGKLNAFYKIDFASQYTAPLSRIYSRLLLLHHGSASATHETLRKYA
jgi:hypothetical protein